MYLQIRNRPFVLPEVVSTATAKLLRYSVFGTLKTNLEKAIAPEILYLQQAVKYSTTYLN